MNLLELLGILSIGEQLLGSDKKSESDEEKKEAESTDSTKSNEEEGNCVVGCLWVILILIVVSTVCYVFGLVPE